MSDAENRPEAGHRLPELVEIMRRLLAPDGCPWDREQTLDTLKPYLLEETYEILEALDHGSAADHCEELGDLLMQIVFHAALRQAEGAFDIDDVIAGIVDKLIRRHPHVFADASADTTEDVLAQWQVIKAAEKRAAQGNADGDADGGAAPERLLASVPPTLPALARAQNLAERAARVGFDADSAGPYWQKLEEESGELQAAADQADPARIEAEVGDLLFTVVNLARKLGCDAEGALRKANHRFAERFAYIEDRLHERGSTPASATRDEMDQLWEQAKDAG